MTSEYFKEDTNDYIDKDDLKTTTTVALIKTVDFYNACKYFQ